MCFLFVVNRILKFNALPKTFTILESKCFLSLESISVVIGYFLYANCSQMFHLVRNKFCIVKVKFENNFIAGALIHFLEIKINIYSNNVDK